MSSPMLDLPRVKTVHPEATIEGRETPLTVGDQVGSWAFMGVSKEHAWFEDFTSLKGDLVALDSLGHCIRYPKSAEPTWVDPKSLYNGHTLAEVAGSDHDLLGREMLAGDEDPDDAKVKACAPPIAKMETHTFVATKWCHDKVGLAYGGQSASFDAANYHPSVEKIKADKKVVDGLVGGFLPVARFVYPQESGDWTEMVVLAALEPENGNPYFQPTWYRICRVEGGRLAWANYFDSASSFPPRMTPETPGSFYQDLADVRESCIADLDKAAKVSLPDQELVDMCSHSLLRTMITRVGPFPKYGVRDRNYGSNEHDGFLDTTNVETAGFLEWGLYSLAKSSLDNFLTYWMRDDGSLLYRGPETGQLGRFVTVFSDYIRRTGDKSLWEKHQKRLLALIGVVRDLRKEAKELPQHDPAHGIPRGWCEADACIDPNPLRYMQPYLSNGTELARALHDLAEATGEPGLKEESEEQLRDVLSAIEKSRLATTPPCIPSVAGAKDPFDFAIQKEYMDPQMRGYRAYMEMLYSGCLPKEVVDQVVDYREARRDIVLGVPAAYGYNTTEIAGFLAYGHAYGLLQHGRIREYLLMLSTLRWHQYTRGLWTAPETRKFSPDFAVNYATPAQMTLPMLVRWALVWEEPFADVLHLGKAIHRSWLKPGRRVAVDGAPTRWGEVSYELQVSEDGKSLVGSVHVPEGPSQIALHLRLPLGVSVERLDWNGSRLEPEASELWRLPQGKGKLAASLRHA